MSVLVKGMEMPQSCLECRLFNDPWCMAKNRNQWRTAYNRPPKGEKQNDCPLVRVPPHSDLIDRDKLREKEFIHDGDAYAVVMSRDIRNAATIIPAEESNMDSFIRIFEEDDEEDGMDSFIRILKD